MKKGQFTKNQNNQLIDAPIVEGVDRELFNDDGQCFKAGCKMAPWPLISDSFKNERNRFR